MHELTVDPHRASPAFPTAVRLGSLFYERLPDEMVLDILLDFEMSSTLDDAIERLSVFTDSPYEFVASFVKRKMVVVEFEKTPRPFPMRKILVRRL